MPANASGSHAAGKGRRPPKGSARINVLIGSLLCCCAGGCVLPDAAFVRSERATFDTVAPEYRAYVASDPGLGAEQRQRRLRTVETWDVSIREQERAGGRR